MQLRDLLLSSLATLTIASASAQTGQKPAPHTKVVKTDTIVIRKPLVKPGMPAQTLAANAVMAVPEKKPYKPVPLAGEKAYYGTMDDYIKEFVKKYLRVHQQTLSVVMGRGNTQFSLMDNVLQQHDIPKELKYLAVIESALNHNAVSRVGAVGPWQFMASTARMMGLKVSGKKDERRDLYKSTNAAAKYLAYLYDQLNDWLLVVAAYNSGPAPIHRAIARTGSNSFWDIKQHLPKETQGHVMAFIATATIFENMSKFIGISDLPDDMSVTKEDVALVDKKAMPKKPKIVFSDDELKNMAIVRLSEPLSEELMVKELGLDKKTHDKWNPDYDMYEMGTYATEFYSLRIPKEKLDNFIEKKEMLTKRSRQIYSALNM
ncbi:lytic transglycosylase domain-containing protein [Polluticoccus soli]|uniref:lytic transglycosylase domain-containing protein n=1 Tax=Polluticoccus soli TaxID=3034150 RepID=UPI0023E2C771|nr:lytic transglycosylase domain-containing protein [Flavipsychrobacter sp. JY13-12]